MTTSTRTQPAKKTTRVSLIRALSKRVKDWWAQEGTDWDDAVSATGPESLPGGEDLWNDMPEVDSKAIARSTTVFEDVLGMPLKATLIRPGGYRTIEEAIEDLIPKMVDKAIKAETVHVTTDGS
jgi:hypothetical protein